MSVTPVSGTNNSLVIPEGFDPSTIDVFKITVPSFPVYFVERYRQVIHYLRPDVFFEGNRRVLYCSQTETEELFKKFQSNSTTGPSVVMGLKDRVENLHASRAYIDDKAMHAQNRMVIALIWIFVAALVVGIVLGNVYGVTYGLTMILSIVLGITIIPLAPNTIGVLLGKNWEEKSLNKKTPIVQKDILAAAIYLQENSAAIIKGLKEEIELLEKQLQSIEEKLQSIEKILQSGDMVGFGVNKQERDQKIQRIKTLKAIKAELEGPGKEMLDQLSGKARHSGYFPSYTY